MTLHGALTSSLTSTIQDVIPIFAVILFFQFAVLKRPIQNPKRVAIGTLFVILGLALFLVGLEIALFPLGERMAQQLASPHFLAGDFAADPGHVFQFYEYYWTYLFGFAIGMSTTIAEPSLIAVSVKAEQVSGGTVNAYWLRMAVALGVGFGVALGAFRIVIGIPLPYFILPGYLIVMIQTRYAPKTIVPLAYDSGGVTTSTVTVPLVAALGLGLATEIPNRDPMVDGFGLIAFASLFPMMTVMGYAQVAQWWNSPIQRHESASISRNDRGPFASLHSQRSQPESNK